MKILSLGVLDDLFIDASASIIMLLKFNQYTHNWKWYHERCQELCIGTKQREQAQRNVHITSIVVYQYEISQH